MIWATIFLYMTDYEQFLEENGITDEDCERAKESVKFIPFTDFEKANLRIGTSKIAGQGVFSVTGIPSNVLWPVAQIEGRWTEAGRYMNHSLDPNCGACRVSNGLVFSTKREILPDEELTVNYRDVKRAMSQKEVLSHV